MIRSGTEGTHSFRGRDLPEFEPRLPRSNVILEALPREEQARLSVDLDLVTLNRAETLRAPGETVTHVYFPISGVLSLVTEMASGEGVEVANVGREGIIGLEVMFGVGKASTRSIVQVPGEALAMRTHSFLKYLGQCPELQNLVCRYAGALFALVAQSAGCNRIHPVGERLARWLLMTQDRAGTAELPLTQEVLSQMLGVRRPSVTVAAGMLQDEGLITFRRGRITVLDRPGLEGVACECYAAVQPHFANIVLRD